MSKNLIISPQAGLGNRLRAISSAIVLAKQSGRKIHHAWSPMTANEKRPFIIPLQKYGFQELFVQDEKLPLATTELFPSIDICFAEWIREDYWYKFQGNAQREFNISKFIKLNNSANSIYESSANNILLETSLPIRLSNEFGYCSSDEDYFKELHQAYQSLTPQSIYSDVINKLNSVDVGIAIRRGDLIKHSQQANQDLDKIKEWILGIHKEKSVIIFSDDLDVRKSIEDLIPNYDNSLSKLIETIAPHQSAFIQFLYLANKCGIVCGTPSSSFAQEAAIFGGKKYYHNLSLIN